MNIYKKFASNVYIAKCKEEYQKGDKIIVTTKHKEEKEHIVHNFIKQDKEGFFYYSITRADGFDHQAWVKRKTEKFANAAEKAAQKSDEYYERANKDSEFLSLGEPIKVGHHSEKRHRRIIENAQNNSQKSFEESKRAEKLSKKAERYQDRAEEINLSMPVSIEYYELELNRARAYHKGLKDGSIEKEHSYSLTYARKKVKELEKKVELAKILWG